MRKPRFRISPALKLGFEQWSGLALLFHFAFVFLLIASVVSYVKWSTVMTVILSSEVRFAVRLSLITATATTAISILLGIPSAYRLARGRLSHRNAIDAFLDIPLVLPPVATGVALLLLFQAPWGRFLERLGLHFVFTTQGIILAQFAVVGMYSVRLLKSTFEGIDARYEKVARTLGCTSWQAFRRITLPLARPGIIAGIVLTWARAMGEFGATVTFVGATRMKTEVLPIAIYLNLAAAEPEKTVATALVLIILSFCALIGLRLLTSGMRKDYAGD